jgi:hypothetical protein
MAEDDDMESLKAQWREQALKAVSRASAEGEERGRIEAETKFTLQQQIQAERLQQLERELEESLNALSLQHGASISKTTTTSDRVGAGRAAHEELAERLKKMTTKRAKSFLSEVFTRVQDGVGASKDDRDSFLSVVRSVLVGEVDSLTSLFHETVDSLIDNDSISSEGKSVNVAVQASLGDAPISSSSITPNIDVLPVMPAEFPTLTSRVQPAAATLSPTTGREKTSYAGGHRSTLVTMLSSSVHPPAVCVWPVIREAAQEGEGVFAFMSYKVHTHIAPPPLLPPHQKLTSPLPILSHLNSWNPEVQGRRTFAVSTPTVITMNAGKR